MLNLKYTVSREHESDLVYYSGCSFVINCNCISVSNYMVETNVRIGAIQRGEGGGGDSGSGSIFVFGDLSALYLLHNC